MKILFITREGFELAGGRIRCYDIAQCLNARGHNAAVFSMSDTLGAQSGKEESQLTNWGKIRLNIQTFFSLLLKPRQHIFIIQRVNYHSFAPFAAAWLTRTPFILDIDDWEFSQTADLKAGPGCGSKALRLCRFLAKRALCCTVSSDFLYKFISQFTDKTYKLPSGVNTDRFLFAPAPIAQPGKKIILGWLGTFYRPEDISDVEMLLEIFADFIPSCPECELRICGDGIWAGKIMLLLENHPKEVSNRVVFTGWLAPDEIKNFIHDVDIGLNPVVDSTRFNLSKCPVSLLEFMACATPVVSSQTGEPANIIDNGKDGFTVQNTPDFVKKLRMLAKNPELRASIGKNAQYKIHSDYSTCVLAEKLMYIIEENSGQDL